MIYCPVIRRPQYSELIIIFITAVHSPHFVTMTCIIGSIMIFILFYYLSTHLVCFYVSSDRMDEAETSFRLVRLSVRAYVHARAAALSGQLAVNFL